MTLRKLEMRSGQGVKGWYQSWKETGQWWRETGGMDCHHTRTSGPAQTARPEQDPNLLIRERLEKLEQNQCLKREHWETLLQWDSSCLHPPFFGGGGVVWGTLPLFPECLLRSSLHPPRSQSPSLGSALLFRTLTLSAGGLTLVPL
jgi:hypothetical protein